MFDIQIRAIPIYVLQLEQYNEIFEIIINKSVNITEEIMVVRNWYWQLCNLMQEQ